MIIPIKCFSCGTVLANKYRYYCEEVRKQKLKRKIHPDRYPNDLEKNKKKKIKKET